MAIVNDLKISALRAKKNIPEIVHEGLKRAEEKGRPYELKKGSWRGIDFPKLGGYISQLIELGTAGIQNAKDMGARMRRDHLMLPKSAVDAYCTGCEVLEYNSKD